VERNGQGARIGAEGRLGVMLKRFMFRNCYSFKGKTALSMEAVYAMKDNWDFVVDVGEEGHNDYILPVAAIYGANAGGKSNVILALKDAAQNICERNDWVRNIPFVLTDKQDDTFDHGFNLLIGKHEYLYTYTAGYGVISSEHLMRRPVGSKDDKDYENVFLRTGETVDSDTILSPSDFETIKKAAINTTYLIVNSVGTMGIAGCSDIYEWCKSVLAVTLLKNEEEREGHLNEYASHLAENDNAKNRLDAFINKFTPSIAGVRPFESKGETPDKRHILGVGHHYLKTDGTADIKYLRTRRESNGTLKMLEMYPTLVDMLDNGKTLVIDELDTMLHPLVFKRIVSLFNDKKTNPHSAQLIFAAHNTEVLNREDLRRDEIHIINKEDNDGVSSIVRLSGFVDENGNKVRMDARYDRIYLEGLLGSIPVDFQDAIV
jgi:hypothetical protein